MSADPSLLATLRQEAVRAVLVACKLCVSVQSQMVSEDSIAKKDSSPVTVADFGAQAVIIDRLTQSANIPSFPFIAEESGSALQEKPELRASVYSHALPYLPRLASLDHQNGESELIRVIEHGFNKSVDSNLWWTLDPIDGTQGFLRRGQYAVALALMENNQPILGVLGCPELPHQMSNPDGPKGQILVAVKGQGAVVYSIDELSSQENSGELGPGQPLRVSSVSDSSKAEFTESFERRQSAQDINAILAQELGVTVPPVRIDSQCKYAIVARGESSIYARLSSLSYKEKIWDHAAGMIVVEEAGGRVTDWKGNRLDYSLGDELVGNVGILCTNGTLHDTVLEAIVKIDAIGRLSK